MHAHANVSGNCVRCIDAEIQEVPILMCVSILLIGTQLLRLERLSVYINFLPAFIPSNFMYMMSTLFPRNLKYLTTPIYPLIRRYVIPIFVVSIEFDSSFTVKVFDRPPD